MNGFQGLFSSAASGTTVAESVLVRGRQALVGASLALALVLGTSALTGCTTVSRGLGSITANKYASPRAGSNWIVPPPQLEPVASNQRTAYVSFQNISDATAIDLAPEMKSAATARGWRLVSDPTEAQVRLRASLRYFGEVEPESQGRGVAQTMGVITGAATGLGTAAAVNELTDSWVVGGAAGVGAGGLVGYGIANGSTVREWAMIVDFVLEERSEEPVEFELAVEDRSSMATGAGVANSRMATGGGTSQQNSRHAAAKQRSNYFPHGVRLAAWANQMNMNDSEALPLIQSKVQSVVQQMLPQ